ncbi:MAG TPA: hypothetical protein VIQ30_24150 [Pseudonocardia sp.]
MNHVTDCTDVLCHDCRATNVEVLPRLRARIATLRDYQTGYRRELEAAIERIEHSARVEGPAPLASMCEYDSGSATGNRPLCSERPVYGVTYTNGSSRFTDRVCKRHRRPTENRVWHSLESTTAL